MKKKRYFGRGALTLLAAAFAFLFLMPTVLTITNSFMTQSEITANYGEIFQSAAGSGYISEKVHLKFIPDMVSFAQYKATLLTTPDYLLKFWNSVILVVPIVVFQVLVAAFAAYSFTCYRGKCKDVLFFFYIIFNFLIF